MISGWALFVIGVAAGNGLGWLFARERRRVEIRILRELQEGEASSYDLWNRSRASIGSVFAALQRLEEDGLVSHVVLPGGAERGYREKWVYRLRA